MSPTAGLHRHRASWQVDPIFLELVSVELLAGRLSAIGIHGMYVETVLGQIDSDYLHGPLFAMLFQGLPVWHIDAVREAGRTVSLAAALPGWTIGQAIARCRGGLSDSRLGTALGGGARMNENSHLRPSNIRGLNRMVIDAIIGITDLVEAMHVNIARLPGAPRSSTPGPARGITGFVYRSVRAITGGMGQALDLALARLAPILSTNSSGVPIESVSAAVNGVLGDYLARTGNPMAISMRLRRDGRPLDLERSALAATIEQPSCRLLVLVHGLCMHDLQWCRDGQDPAATLANDLGQTALYLHYNSGRHISVNGREFANLLEKLVEQWPVAVESLTIVAHSMGGLVSRSACEYAAAASMRWPSSLRSLFFIATPHHGAPLERIGNWMDLMLSMSPYTEPLARLGKIRSAGITDLRYGNLVDADWQGHDRFAGSGDRRRLVPLPTGLLCYTIAGTESRPRGGLSNLLGDGLVPLDSALGRHEEPGKCLDFRDSRQWIGEDMGHLELLTHPEVWERIRDCLSAPSGDSTATSSRAA